MTVVVPPTIVALIIVMILVATIIVAAVITIAVATTTTAIVMMIVTLICKSLVAPQFSMSPQKSSVIQAYHSTKKLVHASVIASPWHVQKANQANYTSETITVTVNAFQRAISWLLLKIMALMKSVNLFLKMTIVTAVQTTMMIKMSISNQSEAMI